MNSSQTLTHRVERTLDGRFAVVDPHGETLAVVCDEFLAIRCAADLDAEPVRVVEAAEGKRGRWEEEKAA